MFRRSSFLALSLAFLSLCAAASAQDANSRLNVDLVVPREMRYDAVHTILTKLEAAAITRSTATLRVSEKGTAASAEIQAGSSTPSKDVIRIIEVLLESGVRKISLSPNK